MDTEQDARDIVAWMLQDIRTGIVQRMTRPAPLDYAHADAVLGLLDRSGFLVVSKRADAGGEEARVEGQTK